MTTVSLDLVAYDKGSKAFDKMADSGQKLNTQLDKLGKTTATAKVDVDTSKADGAIAKFGPKFTAGAAAIGLAAGAALSKGFTDAMDTQSALKKLDAQLGASEFDSKKHGKIAGQLYAEAYGESMSDVTEAIKSVVQNLDGMRDSSEEDLKAISAGALNAAAVLDEEVGPVTRAVAQMLRTKLAKSADEAFDILVFGAQHGADVAGDLLDTFTEYSTQFRDLGIDGKAALGILRQGLRGGARDADIVADAMKELNIRVQDKSAAGALKELGLNGKRVASAFAEGGPKAFAALDQIMDRLRKVKDPTDKYRLAQALLGTQSEDLAKALLEIDPSEATQGMDELAGSTQRAGDTFASTAESQITSWWRTVEQQVVGFLRNEVLPEIQEFIGKLDFSEVVAKVEEIAGKLKMLWDRIFADITDWADKNKGKIDSFASDTESAFENFSGAITAVIDFLTAAWDHGGEELFNVAFATMGNVLNIISGFLQQIEGIFQIFTGLLTGDWDKFWEGIRNVGEGMTKVIGNVLDGAMRLIVGSWGGNWDEMKRKATDKLGEIVDTVKSAVNGIIKAWNWVSEKLGLPSIPLLGTFDKGGGGGAGTQRLMATGGVVPGFGNTDSVPALLTPGEVVFSKLAIKNMGGLRAVDALHAAARDGRSGFERLYGGDRSEPGLVYFADGGAVLKGLAFARNQVGKPYVWGATGPGGYDCSGLMSAMIGALTGSNPYARRFATGSFSPGHGVGGLMPGLNSAFGVGVVRGNPGHMAGTLGGVNIEATPPVVRMGPSARGANSSMFDMQFSLPEIGGKFIGGGGFNAAAIIRGAFANALSAIGAIGGGAFASGASQITRRLADNVISHLIAKVPGFADGGVVPGPYGSPQLIQAHGGEYVSALGWERRLADALRNQRGGNQTVVKQYHLTVINANNREADVRSVLRRMELMDGVA